MALSLKELTIILVIAAAVFGLARPVALLFSTKEDFARRRNTWCLLTAVAFLSPSFWIFAAIAVPVLLVIGRRDSAPAALYLMLLHVIPPISITIPMVGIASLLPIDNYLLLSFVVLTPAAIQILVTKNSTRIHGLKLMDVCVVAYGILQSILYIHQQNPDGTMIGSTFTDDLRRTVVFFFGNFIPYYVVSRSCTNRRVMLDIMATFCLSSALMAGIAIFETSMHWLLYGEMADRWGYGARIGLYLTRSGSVRAIASTGHSLALGYLLTLALGFWMYLREHVRSATSRFSGTALFWMGLLATYARGPWFGALFLYFAVAMLRPKKFGGVLKLAGISLLVVAVISLTPLGQKIVSAVPFLGGAVIDPSLLYRERLIDRAVQIIQDNLLWGDQYAYLRMQDLRQGQGIIDLVNTYLEIALATGVVGLTLLLSIIGIGARKVWVLSRQVAKTDPDLNLLGVVLLSSIFATLIMFADGSFGTGLEKMFYVLAGLAAGYAHLALAKEQRVGYYAAAVSRRIQR